MKNKRFKTAAGFTLMEMMIVVVIIAVLAAMAGPTFSRYIPRMKLKSDAREKVNYLRQARSKAITDNCQYGVFFDNDRGQIIYFKDIGNPELAVFDHGQDSLMCAPILNGAEISLTNCSFSNNTVIFYANGSASTSGSVEVANTRLGESFNISILASTGRIRLQ